MFSKSIVHNNTKSNKKIGNDTEKEFARLMYDKGYVVIIIPDKIAGQPCDIVMSKNNVAHFIDVKHVQDKDYFLHSRIEQNQHNTFKLLLSRGTTNCGFAIKFSNDCNWYYLPYSSINMEQKKTYKTDMIKI